MKYDNIVVIGGGGVEMDEQGNYFTRMALADYLHELAKYIGCVHFFPQVSPLTKNLQFTTRLDEHLVHIHPLQSPHQKSWHKVIAWLQDVFRIIQCSRNANGVIEFVPAAVVTPIMVLLPITHIAYFGMDPQKRWQPQQQKLLSTRVKHKVLRTMGLLGERGADIVLVRDLSQLQRIKKMRSKPAFQSQPILSMTFFDRRGILEDKETFDLLFVGKLARRKGIEDLLAALAILVQEEDWGTNCRLIMVGNAVLGEDCLSFADIHNLARTLGVMDCVVLTGFIDDASRLSQLYSESDLFVLPTRKEGYPRVLDEASMYGLPIIATNLPEIASIMQHEKHAILVEPENPRALANGIKQLFLDSDLRSRVSHQAFLLAEANLDESAAAQHARLLKEYTS